MSFYFDPRSPMLLQLKTGHVAGFTEGQRALIHLVSTAQRVEQAGVRYVFSDGHGLARFTRWFDSLANLDQVDWDTVRAHFWADQPDDLDRQRRKQAEFLVHQSCGWEVLSEILVLDAGVKARVEAILSGYDEAVRRPVRVAAEAYY